MKHEYTIALFNDLTDLRTGQTNREPGGKTTPKRQIRGGLRISRICPTPLRFLRCLAGSSAVWPALREWGGFAPPVFRRVTVPLRSGRGCAFDRPPLRSTRRAPPAWLRIRSGHSELAKHPGIYIRRSDLWCRSAIYSTLPFLFLKSQGVEKN